MLAYLSTGSKNRSRQNSLETSHRTHSDQARNQGKNSFEKKFKKYSNLLQSISRSTKTITRHTSTIRTPTLMKRTGEFCIWKWWIVRRFISHLLRRRSILWTLEIHCSSTSTSGNTSNTSSPLRSTKEKI